MKINDFFYTMTDIGISKPRWLLVTILICVLTSYFQPVFGDPILPTFPQIDPARIKARLTPSEEAGMGGYVKPSKEKESERVLEKAAKKLAQVKSEAAAAPIGEVIKFKLSSVVISGGTVYKKGELTQYYQPYLGKDISFQDLQNIANAITARYRKDGYVISRAIVPVQEVKEGVVNIQIIEGYVAEIYIEGEISKVRTQIEACGKKIKQMRPLQTHKLERYVLSLNDIQGLTVKTVLSPATAAVGAADLTFVVEQQRVAANISFDNRGSRYMGPDQVLGVISVHDFIVGADNMSLQTADTPVDSELRYLQMVYSLPLGIDGWRVNFDASLTETRPGFTIDGLGLIGRSNDWGLGVEYPLMRTRTKNIWLYGQFEWLDSYTRFPGDSYTYTMFKDRIRSLRFGASYDFIDKLHGANLIGVELSKGLIHSSLNPTTPLSRDQGRSDYVKMTANVSRYQALGERFVLLVAANGQYAFRQQLLSAEEFSFGGQQFGRAYDPSEIAGDSGIVGKAEFRANTYPDLRFLQEIQYYTFYDAGVVWGDGVGETRASGTDFGGGLRTTFDKYFYGNIELAKPLTRGVDTQRSLGCNPRAWRLYFGLGLRM